MSLAEYAEAGPLQAAYGSGETDESLMDTSSEEDEVESDWSSKSDQQMMPPASMERRRNKVILSAFWSKL